MLLLLLVGAATAPGPTMQGHPGRRPRTRAEEMARRSQREAAAAAFEDAMLVDDDEAVTLLIAQVRPRI